MDPSRTSSRVARGFARASASWVRAALAAAAGRATGALSAVRERLRQSIGLPAAGGLAAAVVATGLAIGVAAAADIVSDLVDHWKFDDGAGTTAANAADATRPGTAVGASWVTGRIHKALQFDGASNHVQAGLSGLLDRAPSTVSAWIRLDALGRDQFIVDESNRTDFGGGLSIRVTSANRVRFWGQDAATHADSATTLTTGVWYMVTGVFDGSRSRVYVNGVLDATGSAGVAIARSVRAMRIGHSELLGGRFQGTIDDVRLYRRALSGTDVQALYDATRRTLSGTVFEDVNYGGGSGRDRATALAAGGTPRAGARVEVYDGTGAFVDAVTTDASGQWSYGVEPGAYTVRVVNATVRSARAASVAGLLPVQTFATQVTAGVASARAGAVGGEAPSKVDAGSNTTGATLASLATASTAAQSVTAVPAGDASVAGIDFGFNFSTIVNTNDAGQGSLRQFVVNTASTLPSRSSLAQSGSRRVAGVAQALPAGVETSIFMIPSAALTNGVAVITLQSALADMTTDDLAIDGTTQTVNVGDTNAGAIGTGGTVGVDAIALPQVLRPEVQISGSNAVGAGLTLSGRRLQVRGLSIVGPASSVVFTGGSSPLIEETVLGLAAAAPSLTDPGSGARTSGNHVSFSTVIASATIRNSLIAFAGQSGIVTAAAPSGLTVQGNEFRGNSAATAGYRAFGGDFGDATISGNLVADTRGAAFTGSLVNGTVTNNTFDRNGLDSAETNAFYIGRRGTLSRNVFTRTVGNAVSLDDSGCCGGTFYRITRNSFFGNNTGATANAPGAISLVDTRAASARLANDGARTVGRPNQNMDSPVFTSASASGSTLTVAGYVGTAANDTDFANGTVEVYVSTNNATGFGEGQTYVGQIATDASGNFSGTIAIPAGVTITGGATRLTATFTGATIDGSAQVTSEFGANAVTQIAAYGVVGPRMWVDASDVAGDFNASAQPGIGSSVAQLTDKTGNGLHFTSSAGANPVLTNVSSFKRPVLRFTTSQWMMQSANFPAPVTVVYVSALTSTSASGRTLTASANNWLLGWWGGHEDKAFYGAWVNNPTSQRVLTPRVYSAVIRGTGQNSEIWRDTTLLAANTAGVAGPNGLEVNRRLYANEPNPADVAEILVFPRVLSSAELQSVQSGLMAKWYNALTLSGTVFEDVNYGGGPGRDRATALAGGGSGRSGARVELYAVSGGTSSFVAATTTDANGAYAFGDLVAGTYQVRVVNSTVTSGRAGATTGLLPVQTFRTDAASVVGAVGAVTDRVGGESPALADAGSNTTSATLESLTTATATAQSVAPVQVASAGVAGVDFGFSFSTVVNVNDSGAGSLRQAITNANALGGDASLAQAGRTAGVEHVVFMIPNGTTGAGGSLGFAAGGLRASLNAFSGGVATIAPATALPAVSTTMTIDAQAQPGWDSGAPRPVVAIAGSAVGAGGIGLDVSGAGVAVRGFVVRGFNADANARGIRVTGANATIQGNWVGLDAAGTAASANGIGIAVVGAPGVLIGGTTAAARNVISGNTGQGLHASGAATTGLQVQGNYFGTGAAGTTRIGNYLAGVTLTGGVAATLGGPTPQHRNVISGSTNSHGVEINANGAAAVTVSGNYVGLGADGLTSVPNLVDGIVPWNGTTGATTITDNVIGSNGRFGIFLYSGSGHVVRGNRIGLAADGTTLRGNVATGIVANSVSASTIGGTGAGEANTITGSPLAVDVATNAHRISVRGNAMYGNTTAGIDLRGIAANDGVKVAAGTQGNRGMDAPVLYRSTVGPTTLTVSGHVGSAPNQTTFAGAIVDVYEADGSGKPQGRRWIGQTTTDASGAFLATFESVTGLVAGTSKIVATATDADGNTSEFSAESTSVELLAFRNGSFETSTSPPGAASYACLAGGSTAIGGWVMRSNGACQIHTGLYAASAGSVSVDLNNGAPGGIQQTFRTVPGTSYVMSFSLAGDLYCTTPAVKTMNAGAAPDVNNAFSFDITGKTATNMGYVRRQFAFVATSEATTVVFDSTTSGCSGNHVDDVVLGASGTISGTVFEDANYGGGPGRDRASAGGLGRPGARVELYTVSGGVATFSQVTTTEADGSYAFPGVGDGSFAVRVVGGTVSSSRAGFVSGTHLPVPTYRTDAAGGAATPVRDHVGGTAPAAAEAGQGAPGATFATATGAFASGASGTAQSFSLVTVSGGGAALGVDFGFNFSTVVNVNDAGRGSLRQAMTNANALGGDASLAQAGRTAGLEHLVFMIPNGTSGAGGSLGFAAGGLRASLDLRSGGVATIAPATALPQMTTPVAIDAQAQPGWTQDPVVQLSATVGSRTNHGLQLAGAGSVLRGVAVAGFDGTNASGGTVANPSGIYVSAGPVTLQGNWVGLGASGTAAANYVGVTLLNAAASTVGGPLAAQRNVLSGNVVDGLQLSGTSTGVTISGNRIGTDPAGAAARPNGRYGINLSGGASGATIGGTAPGAGNLISGNVNAGLLVGTGGATIQGNRIGTNEAGTAALANLRGLYVLNSGNHLIGGPSAGARNLISGNAGDGVLVSGTGTSGIVVQGNYLGTDATGETAIPNQARGFYASAAAGLVLGGGGPLEGNVISGNATGGVLFGSADGAVIRGNVIGLNAGGTARLANKGHGLHFTGSAADVVVGGTAVGERNVISGNTNYGVFLEGGSASGLTIQGNRIGTDAAGAVGIGNGSIGVQLSAAVRGALVGGTAPGAGNLISGNGSIGLRTYGESTVVQGNRIGTDASGTVGIGNGSAGLTASAASIVIGGTTPAERNLVSGNAGGGILVGSGGPNVVVKGNYVGVDATGAAKLENRGVGITISGAAGATVGGAEAGAGNLVSGNRDGGIRLESGASATVVRGNVVGLNLAGTAAIANGSTGITVASGTDHVIGGADGGAGNVVSGNLGAGVSVSGSARTVIEGNRIGTNAAGDSGFGNTSQGVWVGSASTDTRIGGAAAGAGNVIAGNGSDGIRVEAPATGTLVHGNVIGLDAAGAAKLANGGYGVNLASGSSGNTIGGASAAERNLISGNGMAGVYLSGAGNTVSGNWIGLDATGQVAIPNTGTGVIVTGSGATGHTIGGTAPGAGNVIAGHASYGVQLSGSGGTTVQGNTIGLNATGTAARPNGGGIWASGSGHLIGGAAAGAGNLISGNTGAGILLTSSAAPGIAVRGNRIGPAASGGAGLGNGGDGVLVQTVAATIGGTAPGEANVIAFNGQAGVAVSNAGNGAAIRGNEIRDNAGQGIDLGDNGTVLANDGVKGAVGSSPNLAMDFPVITRSLYFGGSLAVRGYVGSAANQSLFANAIVDVYESDGAREGRRWLGSLTADANGAFDGSIAGVSGLSEGTSTLTATATDANGNTSEFGVDLAVFGGLSIAGTVFEDRNYGGGPGRDRATAVLAGGAHRSGARVELYDSAGAFVNAVTTDGNGEYAFAGLHAGSYSVRVSLSTVTSGRTGFVAGSHLPVLTFRTDASGATVTAVADRVGGESPSLSDAPSNTTSATLASLTTASATAQSVAPVTVSATDRTGVDFGFNFSTVVNVKDAGAGSLRQAIVNANALGNDTTLAQAGRTAGIEHVVFMIPNGTTGAGGSLGLAAGGLRASLDAFSAGVATIAPTSALAGVSAPLVIDAQTQPGWTTRPIVELSGANAGAGGVSALQTTSASLVVRGLIINRWSSAGVRASAAGLVVQGNWFGIDAGGTAAAPNGWVSVAVLGGTTTNALIGGTSATQRNVISGALVHGVLLESNGNTVSGNYIGTDPTGSVAIPNVSAGVRIRIGASQNTIGGTTAGSGNVISGNGSFGISITESASTGNTIRGNLIGVAADGVTARANGAGVDLRDSAANTVGGIGAGEANTIVSNGGAGVSIASGGVRNIVRGNAMRGNGGQGIDLGGDGTVLANDGAIGTGANLGIDSPVITTASLSGASLTLAGHVGIAPNDADFANATIDVYLAEPDASGFGEGRTWVGALSANGSGNFSGTIAVPAGVTVAAGSRLTATATGATAGTSEFGANYTYGYRVSGTVFEDVNYGGGAGRDRATASAGGGGGRGGARVELYDSAGGYLAATTTAADGGYAFDTLASGSYSVRVVNATVPSGRAGWSAATHLPVQTFRTDAATGTAVAVTDRVGGEAPAKADAASNTTGATLESLSTATSAAQSVAPVTVTAGAVSNVDFGFNFSTIVNTNDAGQGSLRQFIAHANAFTDQASLAQGGRAAGVETSIFQLPASDPGYQAATTSWRIGLAAALPALSRAKVALDATTQAGVVLGDLWAGTPHVLKVAIDGNGLAANGVVLSGADQTVRGFAIGNLATSRTGAADLTATFTAGIRIDGATRARIASNHVGTDVTGNALSSIGWFAVVTSGSTDSTIGGSGASDGNVLAGATQSVLQMLGDAGTTIRGNFIGSNARGDASVGSSSRGISHYIGTATVREIRRNLIVGQSVAGILINADDGLAPVPGQSTWSIAGNHIGVNRLGTAAIANATGVKADVGSGQAVDGLVIGGTAAGDANVISGNTSHGIDWGKPSTTGLRIVGNLIGRNASNGANLPNGGHGILVSGSVSGVIAIGGTAAGESNTIAGNAGRGVALSAGTTTTATIRGNSIFDNGSAGIDLGVDGVTANDGARTVGQPNQSMDFPVLTSATLSGATLTISGYAGLSANDATFGGSRVDVYVSDGPPGTNGSGRTWLGTIDTGASTGAFTGATLTLPAGVSLTPGTTVLTATATDVAGAGGTSEFGPNLRYGLSVSGTVFEDANYGGGPGRPLAGGGTPVSAAASVELYDAAGAYLSGTTTTSGAYRFDGLAAATYHVRVVGSTVRSNRSGGSTSGLVGVQTFRTDASAGTASPRADAVGGTNPAAADAGAAATGAVLDTATYVFSAGTGVSGGTAQSVAPVSLASGSLSGVDFGFSFSTVVNANDAGQGSLRQVITNANALGDDASLAQAGRTAQVEHVVFMIPNGTRGAGGSLGLAAGGLRETLNLHPGGVATVAPGSPLPAIAAPLVIDARTQPGWTSAPVVELDGTNAGTSANGLTVSAPGSVVRGLAINRFAAHGVDVTSAGTGATIAGNRLGTNVAGTTAAPNAASGVTVRASDVTVGGIVPGDGNVVSGNQRVETGLTGTAGGIAIVGAVTGVRVHGNLVGLTADGSGALPNLGHGIYVAGGAAVTLGDGTAPARNVVSANRSQGIYVAADNAGAAVVVRGNWIGLAADGTTPLGNRNAGIRHDATGALVFAGNVSGGNGTHGLRIMRGSGHAVQGNLIGLSADGSTARGNGSSGIYLDGDVAGGTIGGTTAADRNVVAATVGGPGIHMAARALVVRGNYVGTDVTGTQPRGNGTHGLLITAGATGNTIGGDVDGAGNVIAGNGQAGVSIGTTASGNVVAGNLVSVDASGAAALRNGGVGIEVLGNGNTIGGTTSGARNVVVNGTTGQPILVAGSGNTVAGNRVGLNAAGTASLSSGTIAGVRVSGASNTIGGAVAGAGNVISGNGSHGVYLTATATNAVVSGNVIGLDATGTVKIGNAGAGVRVEAAGARIGGATAAERNVISGNADNGVWISADSVVVTGNYVGTNAAGTGGPGGTEFGNGPAGAAPGGNGTGSNGGGIYVQSGAGVRIGGTPAERNVVSGNLNHGIHLASAATSADVRNNYVGTDANGTAAVKNAHHGVQVDGATGATIGAAGAGNVISGNGQRAIAVTAGTDLGVTIRGNRVGTSAISVDAGIPNGTGGSAIVVFTGATGVTIGGLAGGEGNVVRFNAGPGIDVQGGAAGVAISGNVISGNGTRTTPITLNGASTSAGTVVPTPNDGTTGASQGNLGMDNPVLTRAAVLGSRLLVSGYVGTSSQTIPGTSRVEVFRAGSAKTGYSPYADGSEYRDPVELLGWLDTAADGRFSGEITLAAGVVLAPGERLVATATSAARNTSEVGAAALVNVALAGRVFEDVNYGGGAGRSWAQASENGGLGRRDARVELYDGAGAFVASSLTDASGAWVLPSAGAGTYTLRVVSGTVSPSRPRTGAATVVPVVTFLTDTDAGGTRISRTDRVGGPAPQLVDAGENTTGAALAALSVAASGSTPGVGPTAVASITVPAAATGSIEGLDTGFNFSTVVNVNDAGQGSLRQAITNANALGDADLAQAGRTRTGVEHLVFMIPNGTAVAGLRGDLNLFTTTGGTSAARIPLASVLPSIDSVMVIDAQAQPGWSATTGSPVVQLDGVGITAGQPQGLTVNAAQSTIRGLSVTRFWHGIRITASGSGATLAGNWVGVSADGSAAGNGAHGVLVEGAGVVIGEPGVAGRNVLSANVEAGVALGSSGARIQNNRIGTTPAGARWASDTQRWGVYAQTGASGALVGGRTDEGRGNLISGNREQGIRIDAGAHAIQGNLIGTGASGAGSVPNGAGGVLLGAGAGASTIGGTSSVLRNVISGNTGAGVRVQTASAAGTLIQGNHIGTDLAGTAANRNSGNGVLLEADATGVLVGGTDENAGNLISGNGASGVLLASGAHTVQGNRIGTRADGLGAIGNGGALSETGGVQVTGGSGESGGHLVGGTVPAARNLLSGNGGAGVWLSSASGKTTIQGNWIGVDATGAAPLGNGRWGIVAQTASAATATDLQIGGVAAGAGNVISGNSSSAGTGGIYVHASGVVIEGNRIGLAATGSATIGNGTTAGIEIRDGSNVRIGGTAAGAGNLIAGNQGAGVAVNGTGTGNRVLGNAIWGNGGVGIDLGGGSSGTSPGTTVNDGVKGSASPVLPNLGMDYPVLTSVKARGNRVTVEGYVGTQAGQSAFGASRVELFVGDGDASGHGEGRTYLGALETDAQGNFSGTFTMTLAVINAKSTVTATATDAGGNTSEFGPNYSGLQVDWLVNTAGDAPDAAPDDGLCETATPGECSLRAAIMESNASAAFDTVAFALPSCPGAGCAIRPASPLPAVTQRITIDGTSQPGWSAGTPKVALDGASAGGGPDTDGLRFATGSDGSVVRALRFVNWAGGAVHLLSSSNHAVEGSWFGLDATGATKEGTQRAGVLLRGTGSGHRVGGTDPASRNVIAGATAWGIYVFGPTGTRIEGNFIGTDASGTAKVGNGAGVAVYSAGTVVGGTASGAGNLISGNSVQGVLVSDNGGNASPTGVAIQGNRIGTARDDDAAPLGNGTGIVVQGSVSGLSIGGIEEGAGNTIAFNTGAGIAVPDAGRGPAIRRNRLYANGGQGIDLGADGLVAANDGLKGADRPGFGIDHPIISSAGTDGITLVLSGYVGSTPGQTAFAGARVEFFRADGDASGHGEGAVYLGFLVADGDGRFDGTIVLPPGAGLGVGMSLSATATAATSGAAGDPQPATSEFGPGLPTVSMAQLKPSKLNAFDTATATGSLTGPLTTRVAGKSTEVALIALNSSGTGLHTSFAGSVTVEWLNARDNSGALDANGCRASWTPVGTSESVSFTSGTARRTVALTPPAAGREWRLRLRTTAGDGSVTTSCSNDAFAVLPAALAITEVGDDSSSAPGTTRSLMSADATGGVVHRAGRPFSIRARAVDAGNAVATGYDGTPTLEMTGCVMPASGCAPGTLSFSATAQGGLIATDSASYSEVGAIAARLVDADFAAVDAADTPAALRTVASAPVTIGRFVPDRLALSASNAPVLATQHGHCVASGAPGFTFVGQAFGWSTAPRIEVRALNAAGQPTLNWKGALQRLAAGDVTSTLSSNGAPAALQTLVKAGATVVDAGSGTATVSLSGADRFAFARGAGAPVASFSAAPTLQVTVRDASETAVAGNEPVEANLLTLGAGNGLPFSAGSTFHTGRLVLGHAFGDARRGLAVPVELQRYTDRGWMRMSEDDGCVSVPLQAWSYTQGVGALAAGRECRAAGTGSLLTLRQGRGLLQLPKMADNAPAAMTVILNLSAAAEGPGCANGTTASAAPMNLPYLQTARAGHAGLDNNPAARAVWGRPHQAWMTRRELF